MRTRLTKLTLLSLLILPGPIIAGNHRHTPLYGLFEATIDYQSETGASHSYVDPFYGIELHADFKSPSGDTVPWRGFYDGDGQGGQTGNVWKLRFMPDETGTWVYQWRFPDGSASGSGSFQAVAEGAKPGPLKHDDDIHQWLVTADNSRHVFLNMYTTPSSEKDVSFWTNPQTTIDEATGYGFEVIVNWSTLYYPNRNHHIWKDTSDFIPNLSMWHTMENGLYKKAYDQGIYLYEWDGFYSGNNLHKLDEKPESYQDKVIKYWLAREAPYYMLLFNIGFELEEYVNVPAWPVARANFVKQHDPWNHLITAHQEVSDKYKYGKFPVIGFSALQNLSYDAYHSTALSIWNSPSGAHGHISEGLWNGPWGRPDSESQSRKLYWALITGGSSYFYWPYDDFMGLSAVKAANVFLNSEVRWWRMSPHDEVITSGSATALAKPGSEYIVYSPAGDRFSLNLPAGTYTWEWFNPANGEYESRIFLYSSGGNINFDKPNNKDWVLHIDSLPEAGMIAPGK